MNPINNNSIKFRIYGIVSKYLTEYIEPDINKDEFIEMFNKGKLIIYNIFKIIFYTFDFFFN